MQNLKENPKLLFLYEQKKSCQYIKILIKRGSFFATRINEKWPNNLWIIQDLFSKNDLKDRHQWSAAY